MVEFVNCTEQCCALSRYCGLDKYMGGLLAIQYLYLGKLFDNFVSIFI